MIMTRTCTNCRSAAAVLLLFAAASCSKEAAPKQEAAGAADSALAAKKDMPGMEMKGMPGMEMKGATGDTAAVPETLTFNAAQIQHGGVRWSAVTVSSATAGSAALPGELTVNEDRTMRLGAPGGGRVLAVRVQPGDAVRSGQALVVMQSAEAGMAQSDVAKARAEVTSARAEAQYASSARNRAERLLALKAIPRQDYERAIADDEQAASRVAQAGAELARAQSTARQLGAGGASASGQIVLASPLAGVVLERPAQPGAVVDAGAPLVVVTDPSSLWLQVKTPESFAGLFKRGGSLAFSVPAYPGEVFTARIDAVGAGLDPQTRTLGVRGLVANAGGRLKPSMLATVQVEGGARSAAILLPDDAVQLMNGKPTVFIARPDAKGGVRLEQRVVEVGPRTGGRIAVTRGLSAGDVVVTSGAFAVKAQFQKGAMPEMVM